MSGPFLLLVFNSAGRAEDTIVVYYAVAERERCPSLNKDGLLREKPAQQQPRAPQTFFAFFPCRMMISLFQNQNE
jgi:hypothetical protein